jgi:hypothetical protein
MRTRMRDVVRTRLLPLPYIACDGFVRPAPHLTFTVCRQFNRCHGTTGPAILRRFLPSQHFLVGCTVLYDLEIGDHTSIEPGAVTTEDALPVRDAIDDKRRFSAP